MDELTKEEQDLVRGASLGAMAVVSNSDPGFFAMFKESLAGSKAISQAPQQIRELLDGFTAPSVGAGGNMESAVMDQLAKATALLAGKSTELLEGWRMVVLTACDAVAQASDGVVEAETQMIERVRQAMQNRADAAAQAKDAPQDAAAEVPAADAPTAGTPAADSPAGEDPAAEASAPGSPTTGGGLLGSAG